MVTVQSEKKFKMDELREDAYEVGNFDAKMESKKDAGTLCVLGLLIPLKMKQKSHSRGATLVKWLRGLYMLRCHFNDSVCTSCHYDADHGGNVLAFHD